MKTILLTTLAVGLSMASGLENKLTACGMPHEVLAHQAIFGNESQSAAAMAQLRALGPQGLSALLKAYDAQSEEPQAKTRRESKAAVDKVAGQCDAWASRLFWYTDLEKAKAAARATRKPILSLRLLGKLDEEYSCANSRFFRTTLYPNTDVSAYLRDHFVLHWESVRPVPRITIDFGDGRRLERTITGNSVHYVLDSQGEPVDALPGLYSPKAFLKGLASAEQAALACSDLVEPAKKAYLSAYHQQRRAAVAAEMANDLKLIANENSLSSLKESPLAPRLPSAQAAGRLAISKSAVESHLLRFLQPRGSKRAAADASLFDETIWAQLAQLHSSETVLDEQARAVVLSKSAPAGQAAERTVSKRLVEDPFLGAWRNLQRTIAEDTIRNEYLLHAQIHDWFASGIAPRQIGELNAKVYAELFLMPESDPWLGLAPANAFTGLPNDGLAQAPR
jgi:hypothetical protein